MGDDMPCGDALRTHLHIFHFAIVVMQFLPYDRLMASLLRTALILASTIAVLAAPSGALAAQHQHANMWQDWTMPQKTTWSLEQLMAPQETSRDNYFALVFDFQNVDTGGYMGIQQDGTSFYARKARFSIWNSLYAKPGAGATCSDFGGEGIGKTCTLPFWFVEGRHYKLKLAKVGAAYGIYIWRAHIQDVSSGRTFHIGDIGAAPWAGAIDKVSNFNEYYGPATSCSTVPDSSVFFLAPRIGSAYSTYTPGGNYRGSCSGGRVIQGYGGSALQLGK